MVEDSSGLSGEVLAHIEEGALLNAVRHGGKADAGAVIGRVLAKLPELRSEPAKVARASAEAVKRVNSMSAAQQASLLAEKYPGSGERGPKEGRVGLPRLPNAVKGKAAFRIPPEPSGFMHVGHAMAFTINYLYKEEYSGRLWLRFEDTNPRKVATKYYENFRAGISWLGIKWDEEKNVSDDMDLMYSSGRELLEDGKAYACSCDTARVKELRFEGTPCEHRDAPVERNLKVWDELLSKKHKEGEYVIRFKGDMQSVNYSLRDPNIFRVIDHPHPLTGERYSLWPTYDVANAIEDDVCKITHVLRSSEFRNELQQLIRDALGLRALEVIQFSRFNFKGAPVAKRLLRPLVENEQVSGWDDPRMPTVEGLKRRGIIPETIRAFTLQVGYTKTEHEYDWSLLLSLNRKLLDPVCRRIFFVPDPVPLKIDGAPARKVKIPFHPQSDLGERTIETAGTVLVPRADIAKMKVGDTFRLMDLYNVKLTSAGKSPSSEYAGEELVQDTRKVQWVAQPRADARVLVPGPLFNEDGSFNNESLGEVRGVAEETLASAKVGEIFQFPRFGFCRLDSPGTLVFSS
jgi:glutamyl-tRNA synthetase